MTDLLFIYFTREMRISELRHGFVTRPPVPALSYVSVRVFGFLQPNVLHVLLGVEPHLLGGLLRSPLTFHCEGGEIQDPGNLVHSQCPS